jgi:hypothetical protein
MDAGWDLIGTTAARATIISANSLPCYEPLVGPPPIRVTVDASPIALIGSDAWGICVYDPVRAIPGLCNDGHGSWAAMGPATGDPDQGDDTGQNMAISIDAYTAFNCAFRVNSFGPMYRQALDMTHKPSLGPWNAGMDNDEQYPRGAQWTHPGVIGPGPSNHLGGYILRSPITLGYAPITVWIYEDFWNSTIPGWGDGYNLAPWLQITCNGGTVTVGLLMESDAYELVVCHRQFVLYHNPPEPTKNESYLLVSAPAIDPRVANWVGACAIVAQDFLGSLVWNTKLAVALNGPLQLFPADHPTASEMAGVPLSHYDATRTALVTPDGKPIYGNAYAMMTQPGSGYDASVAARFWDAVTMSDVPDRVGRTMSWAGHDWACISMQLGDYGADRGSLWIATD